jgi:hypothetical protein
LKIDPKKHKNFWRIQKGCTVEWFVGSKKGVGVVNKLHNEIVNGVKTTTSVEVAGEDGSKVDVPVRNLRIKMSNNSLKKKEYERLFYENNY